MSLLKRLEKQREDNLPKELQLAPVRSVHPASSSAPDPWQGLKALLHQNVIKELENGIVIGDTLEPVYPDYLK